jgi:hypothetical protein
MVISEEAKTAKYNKKPTHEEEKAFYSVFLAYIDLIRDKTGKPYTRVLKEANLPISYYWNITKLIQGANYYKPSITLRVLLKLYAVHGVPFNLSEFIHLIEPKID